MVNGKVGAMWLALLLAGCGGTAPEGATSSGSGVVRMSAAAVAATAATAAAAAIEAPTITTQPASATIASGMNTVLSVVAGGAALQYQWYRDGVQIAGATAPVHTATLAGGYVVAVSNGGGTLTSGSATVAVSTLPVISAQPSGAAIAGGTERVLRVAADGAALRYQWYRDGAAIAGATDSRYGASAAGVYYAMVSNAAGQVSSSTATVTLAAATTAPAITAAPQSLSVNSGTGASFTVTADGASLAYQWYKDGVAIAGATGASHAIVTATAASAGSYSVVVSNAAGSAVSSPATLSVTVLDNGANTATVAAAAEGFLATLDPEQKAPATSSGATGTVLFDYSLANAGQWSGQAGQRHGLGLDSGTLTATQLDAAGHVIAAALSNRGIRLLHEVRRSETAGGAGPSRGAAAPYSIAFVGTPSASQPWLLQLGGHHLSYNISYNAAQVSATPLYAAADPSSWSSGGATHAPLETQRAAVHLLAEAIQDDSTVAATARLSGSVREVLMGARSSTDTGYKNLTYPGTERGVRYTALGTAQQALVKAAIESWVNTQAGDVAGALLSVYESDSALSSTYVAYGVGRNGRRADFRADPNAAAAPLASENSYLRIDGPRVWLEFIVKAGEGDPSRVQYQGLWRDKLGDYGGGL